MSDHKNIYEALCAAQSEFGTVTKGASNPAFKSKYADLSDVAGVVIPVLNRHGVAVLAYPVTADGERAMRTEFVHGATETKVSCDVPLIVDKANMQGMKSATTYAKRIGLESLSGIAPEDDDGNAAAKAPPPAQQAKAPLKPEAITHEQHAELMTLFDHLGVPVAEFLKVAEIANLKQLPAPWFARAKRWVNDQAKPQTLAQELADEIAF